MKLICSILIGCCCVLGFAAEVPSDSVEEAPDTAFTSPDSMAHAPGNLGAAIQAKLDSISGVTNAPSSDSSEARADSVAKAKADSIRAVLRSGQYVNRAAYDKRNFDSWKVDTVFQKKMKESIVGMWRTPILEHGHAFRDAELRFGMNDTLYGVTRTYSDSGRYQMTGEYAFHARYRFQDDSTIVSREVFKDRNVVRWDFIRFRVEGTKLTYHLLKLEFRDLNDNWLNALQGFDKVAPEYYFREEKPETSQPVLNSVEK